MSQSSWKSGIGEFEEALNELRRSGYALQEAVEELSRYSDHREYAGLHFTQGLSAIGLVEQRISVAKRKLESFKGKTLFDQNLPTRLEQ